MPAPTAPSAPPAVPTTAVAPTPGQPYALSAHAPTSPASRNPALNEALSRRAGVAPTTPTTPPGEARLIPSQPPRAPLDVPTSAPTSAPAPTTDDKPAPHVKFITPDEREPVAPAAAPEAKPAAPPEPAPEVLKSASAQVREAYERLKADLATRATEGDLTKKELVAFRAKAQSYEDRIKVLEGADARAKELEKQVLTKDEVIRITNYTQSDEYHTTYVKPVSEATQEAFSLVKDLIVADDTSGQQRAGNEQDFFAVLAQPNHTLAKAKAKELFGDDFATDVFQAALKVKSLRAKQTKAFEEAGVRSMEYARAQQERAATSRSETRAAFERTASELTTRYPGLYTPAAEDAEALAARTKGEEAARLVILDGRPEDMPSEQFMAEAARVYQRAASWPMHQLQLARVQAELDATKARLAAYERSSPDAASRQQPGGVTEIGATPVTSTDQMRAQMRESLARRAAGGRR